VPALSGTMPTDTDEERAAAAQIATFGQSGNGYYIEMATRPQTIGYALLDSPVALAAWMIDHDTDAYYKIAHAFVDGEPAGNLTSSTSTRSTRAATSPPGRSRSSSPKNYAPRSGRFAECPSPPTHGGPHDYHQHAP